MKVLKYIFHPDHILVVILSFVLWAGLLVCVYNISFLDPVGRALDNFSMSDMFFEIDNRKNNPDTCHLITLVDMTELHSRADIGELLKNVNECHPICIGIDLIFEGEKDDGWGNMVLENAVTGLGENTVFAQKLVDYNRDAQAFTSSVSSYFAPFIPIREAYVNLTDNLEQANIRELSVREQLQDGTILSFPASIASYIDASLIEHNEERLTINFRHTLFPTLHYDEINKYPELIENHIVLVGALTEEQDMHLTPLGKMSGMMVQAYSLRTLLEHNNIRHFPWYADWLICFLVCWLLQVCMSALVLVANRYEANGIVYFCKKANIFSGALLIVWLVMINYILFVCFTTQHLILDATMLLAMMVILLEGREMYEALVNALAKKYHWKWINNSLFLEP